MEGDDKEERVIFPVEHRSLFFEPIENVFYTVFHPKTTEKYPPKKPIIFCDVAPFRINK
jgi:hypothetical protein